MLCPESTTALPAIALHYYLMADFICAVSVMRFTSKPPLAALLLTLFGCSTHPLPTTDTASDLPIYEIVHRIQCEAASAVKQVHHSKGYTASSSRLEELKKAIKNKQQALQKKQRELAAKSDFGTRKEEIEEATKAISLRAAQIKFARAQLAASSKSEEEKALGSAALDAEKAMVDAQATNALNAWNLLNEASTLNGELSTLSEKLTDPLKEIDSFESHTAVFQFELEVTEDNNLSSTGSVAWPAVLNGLAGSFTIGYDVGDKRQRLAKRTVKLAATFDELLAAFDPPKRKTADKLNCRDVSSPPPEALPRRYPITGNIGLDGVIRDYIAMLRSGKFKAGGESYTDKIQFTTTINGALKPGIDLARKPGPTIKASADISGSRKDVHILTLFLTPPGDGDGEKGGSQSVVITGMPAVRIRGDILRLPP